ncbi:MAG: LPS export ABC transporter periplasmic protein LptC [Ignavibacteria bacterium]|nr:LPS export ABC transporter periplasmic protein LptC [Ignavibacteria bacterium]MBI3766684.1 LPS export ABC transporter periplasmic protein LptC [Ignavibacteriales bacterium]
MPNAKVKNQSVPRFRPLSVLHPLFFVLSFVLLLGCEEKIKPSVASTGLGQDVPTQESWSATITFTDSGRVTAILRAGHIAMFAEKRYTRLDSNIVVDFFDEHERHTSILTAARGQVNDVTHDFEAHENVVVVSDSGTTLKTEDLYWTNITQKVHTPSYVDITSPTEHINGQGFESDQGLKHYTIFKVTGQAKPNE